MNVSRPPLPAALLESLRSIGYTLDTALADLIDNSITAKAGRISIRYLWNNGKPWIAVCDDGHGLSPDELIEAMRLGSRNPNERRGADDLGRFGLGMKTASISQCRRLTVVSRNGKTVTGCDWDLDAIADGKPSDWGVKQLDKAALSADVTLEGLISQHLPSGASGTIVLWRKLDDSLGDPREVGGEHRFSAHMDTARKHLELVFHRFLSPALRQKKTVIDFNEAPLEAFDPFGSPIPARQELTAEKIRIQGHIITVQPYVLPHHTKAASIADYQKLAGEEGYRVIIVLAGTLNSLRNQTQERIDADFIGWCTREKKPIGAFAFGSQRRPVCFTTSLEDFKKQTANAIAMDLAALNEPVVLIIKKNKSTLTNLIEWLKGNNRHNLQNFPMLLIDDEADYASINTKKEEDSPAAINFAIRNLLSLFTRTSFVGYTATPFANIFIDPESEDEMANGSLYKDLFPRDFILSLDPPDNYVGPHRLFTEEADLDCVRDITDNDSYLPIRHKIDFVPHALPASLQRAIGCFIIGKAIRILRGQTGKCHSMMVNASRFTGVQNFLGGLVLDYLRQLKQSIANYAALAPATALQNQDLCFLKQEVFEEEFASAGFDWPEVQKTLRESADPIEVLIVNSSSSDTLDYRPKNYPNGRSVIAVGGLGLSRGLTLEGLITSYFLRNTVMYDTLMQMGRWFGYRDGHADVCRIFMAPDAASWYAHIAEATEELRRDFKSMERAKLTPKDFGLRVRSHPTSLIVTARNKMRTGKLVPMQIALEGRLAATSIVFGDKDSLEQNAHVLSSVCDQCEAEVTGKLDNLGYLWKSVSPGIIITAIRNFRNHPECMLTYADPLVQYIEWLATQQQNRFDVLLRSAKDGAMDYPVGSWKIAPITRTVETLTDDKITFNKRRVGSKGDESAGLTVPEITEVRKNYPGKNVPDCEYRKVKDRSPLFLIYFASVKKSEDANFKPEAVPAYGVSFPGDPGSGRRPAKLVEYVVTTKWWEQNYGLTEDEPEEE